MSEGFIPLSVPNLKGKELEYVTEAVRSEWVSTAGSYVSDFEASIADYVGVRGAVAVSVRNCRDSYRAHFGWGKTRRSRNRAYSYLYCSSQSSEIS